MEVSDVPRAKPADGCLDKTISTLTVDDVYDIAKLIGAEVERLIDGYGKDSALGLVPKVVKVLELLERYASWNQAHKLQEDELLRTFETLQLQQYKSKRPARDCEDVRTRLQEELEQQQQWKKKCEELQIQVQQLQEEKGELHSQLKGSYAKEDRVQRQEREVMLKLKSVVDKQRDELRAKVQEISSISKEVEALQEQLERFMKMNAELRHKQNVMQVQLKSTVERKADMEADLKEKNKEIESLLVQLNRTNSSPASSRQQVCESNKIQENQKDQDQPCFTKKEVRDIIVERNELKTNLFLLQEELNYYQKEILNEERCPGFLLEAVRSAIKSKRKLIKAKMLGIPVNECSNSDDEDKDPQLERSEVDGAVNDDSDKPAESRIKHFFGYLTRSGSTQSPTHMSSSASTWEIIGDAEADGETEEEPSS
ncbi:rab-interacting lysosomal protein [Eucyclogobius newberryi]|uniref:rab-interacting lysosomal protein n=1 Tax=Eucyclogobius newberryi TaxID=166745 RepID=UPI003B5A0A84